MSKKEENTDEMTEQEFEELKNNKFKQQKLSAWRPIPTIWSTTITFVVFGVIFLAIGIIVLIYSNQINETSFTYHDFCTSSYCEFPFYITSTFKAPVMFYYQLDNFYQNHRRYVKSKSVSQMNGGQLLEAKDISTDCDPIVYLNQTGRSTTLGGIPTVVNNVPTVAFPCGLIAKSLFNDTYKLYKTGENGAFFPARKPVIIDETNIAWDSDKKLKYKIPTLMADGKTPIDDWRKYLWTNITDEHFMVWMRPAGLPNFRKLWGRITTDLTPGNYTMTINNNYPVLAFDGKKYIVFSTVNAFGGKNSFLGISYIVVGSICLIMALLFVIGYNVHSKNLKKGT